MPFDCIRSGPPSADCSYLSPQEKVVEMRSRITIFLKAPVPSLGSLSTLYARSRNSQWRRPALRWCE